MKFTTPKCDTCKTAITHPDESQIEHTLMEGTHFLMGIVRLIHASDNCRTFNGFDLTVHANDEEPHWDDFGSLHLVDQTYDVKSISNVNEHGFGWDGDFTYMDDTLSSIATKREPYTFQGWDKVREGLVLLLVPENLDYMYPITEVLETRKKILESLSN